MNLKKELYLEIVIACATVAILAGGYLMFDELRESTSFVVVVAVCIIVNVALIVQKYRRMKGQQ